MNFFDFFKQNKKTDSINDIHDFLNSTFPHMDEERLVILSCFAGLLARIAYTDFNVCQREKSEMEKILRDVTNLTEDEAKHVTEYSIKMMKQLSGLDTRSYCTPLVDILSQNERYKVLKALFAIAAADGEVDRVESNEISYIANSLVLEKKYFLSAQADVKEYLKTLQV
ncbi:MULTISPECIES: TerB family tellurite resistance protein [Halobacteriovorax]|uniref:TerB family tellurite resistance protein n=1 Tax=Halobacteriovorax vibrionivorans TaxID=2152716 RepID=A0ABY0IHM8_9BACT|nr:MULTISPECIES: TerB family tellurite resistance protein [Halobacteriovorax]AYF45371.1 tellurite resistance protein TerB [Halobacteriovorax sp. BALOs_7]RZF22453.1 TerB family tellurite resistance protein [Halobacteriovorax vibrionivorans]TGD47644.1 TerB family tellurite resistance protein [Halobacteriovorax sp. Y22]